MGYSYKFIFTTIAIMGFIYCCAYPKVNVDATLPFSIFQAHKNYVTLRSEETKLLITIVELTYKRTNYSYYKEKLLLLLDTPYQARRKEFSERQKRTLSDSSTEESIRNNIDNNKEELNGQAVTIWSRRLSSTGEYYYVNSDDPLNIFIKIYINIVGDENIKSNIHRLEDAIEKHLSVPGFNVDIIWDDRDEDDVVTIYCDPNEWPTSHNWMGDYMVMAHELMHVFGVADEYNRIGSHAGNKYLPTKQRLRYFIRQLDDVTYYDAEEGIMWHNHKRPLPRHVCWAVGLYNDCTFARVKEYGPLYKGG